MTYPGTGAGHERRRCPRYDLLAHVRVTHRDTVDVLELGNLSRSGALLSFGSLGRPLWLSLGLQTELGIVHPETGETVVLAAEVVRIHQDAHGHGFAVEFVDPDAAATTGLRQLIALAVHRSSAPPLGGSTPAGSAPGGPPPLP